MQPVKSMTRTECSWVVPLRASGAKPPLFCACAGGGDPHGYADLAKALPEDQPVYAFGVPEFGQNGLPTVEQFAEAYLAKIRKIQVAGPYSLCGHSFGGLVAYEMAVRLAKEGEEVGFLALLDTERPGYVSLMPVRQRAAFYAAYFLDRGAKYSINFAKGRVIRIARDVRALSQTFFARMIWPALRAAFRLSKTPLPSQMSDHQLVLPAAMRMYRPPKYTGRIVLFCASDRPPEYRLDPSLGWKVHGFGLEVNHVPGAHTTMLHPPFVKGLAACFEPYLGAVPEKAN